MEKLGIIAIIFIILKFLLVTVAWGILIAIGFTIGNRLVMWYDGRQALRKAVKEQANF